MSKIGDEGAELIAYAINRYMEKLVGFVGQSGGDIFKFAGDAMIVIWPPSTKTNEKEQMQELEMFCRQALESSISIQEQLTDFNVLDDYKLSVKIGFGIG